MDAVSCHIGMITVRHMHHVRMRHAVINGLNAASSQRHGEMRRNHRRRRRRAKRMAGIREAEIDVLGATEGTYNLHQPLPVQNNLLNFQ